GGRRAEVGEGPGTLASPSLPAAAAAAASRPVRPRMEAARLSALRAELVAQARRVPGSAAAIYWEDLETGDAATVGADRVFKSASLIKLPVAVAVLELWQRQPE